MKPNVFVIATEGGDLFVLFFPSNYLIALPKPIKIHGAFHSML
jgi:hypothetical protein